MYCFIVSGQLRVDQVRVEELLIPRFLSKTGMATVDRSKVRFHSSHGNV